MNETNLQNIASNGLFHQIALVSVKPHLTTIIIHELLGSSDMLVITSEQYRTVIVVVPCDFTVTSVI